MSQPRERQTRATEELDNTQSIPLTWRPSGTLPTPDPMPGWTLGWKRVALRGDVDATNWSQAMQEGWRPVDPSEQPSLRYLVDAVPGAATDRLEVGGLVLCKIPREVAQQREDYYQRAAHQQVHSVDARLKNDFAGDDRVKLVNERSTTFGRGHI
jgi:hypothetical protein